MKFVCDQCGKKFATAQDPAPGKVYKLKCTDCGHLIVVKSQADTSTAIPMAAGAGSAATGLAAAPPPALGALLGNGGELVSETGDDPPAEPFAKRLGDSWTDLPAEVSGNFPLPAPPPPDKDELADFAAAAAEVIGAPTPRSGTGTGRDDPFMAAARASLPAGSSDRAARAVQAASTPSPRQPVQSAPAEKSRPRAEKEGGLPVAAIGFGVVVMIVITTIAVVQGKKSEPMSPPPAAVAAPPAPAPTTAETLPAPTAAPAPEPPKAEPTPAPAQVEPKEPAATRPAEPKPAARERRAEPRPAPPRPEPKPAAVAAAPAPAPEPDTSLVPREPTLPDAATVLTPEVVQKVVSANRRAFGACIAKASESDVKLDGRQVALRISVGPSGNVSYPTLDDASLNGTEMGQCLKSAARLMIFPKFSGDQFHIEVPLVLSAP